MADNEVVLEDVPVNQDDQPEVFNLSTGNGRVTTSNTEFTTINMTPVSPHDTPTSTSLELGGGDPRTSLREDSSGLENQ